MKHIKEYLEYCKTHPEFCASLKGLDDNGIEAKMREAGFDISMDELDEGMRELELDDMVAISGGESGDGNDYDNTCETDYRCRKDGFCGRRCENVDGSCGYTCEKEHCCKDCKYNRCYDKL